MSVPADTSTPRRSSAQSREHVLTVARELFYWRGIRATGVDAIAAKAGVAPTTLYRLFASKDDLVAGYVKREQRLYREHFSAVVAAAKTSPRAQIVAIFNDLIEQTQPDQCRGCPFQMSLAELPDPDSPAHQHAVAAKTWVREQFAALATALGANRPLELGDRLTLILEGVYASVQSLGVDGPARQARDLVIFLLDAPERSDPSRPRE